MVFGNSKRIVVIKDIPSNIIEEAIFILKHDPEMQTKEKKAGGVTTANSKLGKDYLLKEAEAVINNYIVHNKFSERGGTPRVALKWGSGKRKFVTNLVINISMVASIALLIFVVSRFF